MIQVKYHLLCALCISVNCAMCSLLRLRVRQSAGQTGRHHGNLSDISCNRQGEQEKERERGTASNY